MEEIKKDLERIANKFLDMASTGKGDENKPNFSNRDFMNCLIIFQNALMDKMYDNQDYDDMDFEDRLKMAESCGNQLSKLIHTYTNLDTHKIENFL